MILIYIYCKALIPNCCYVLINILSSRPTVHFRLTEVNSLHRFLLWTVTVIDPKTSETLEREESQSVRQWVVPLKATNIKCQYNIYIVVSSSPQKSRNLYSYLLKALSTTAAFIHFPAPVHVHSASELWIVHFWKLKEIIPSAAATAAPSS